MADFEKMAESPGMPEFIALNEAGEYKAAYDGLMKLKIEKFGAEKLESWGFEVTEHASTETTEGTTVDQEETKEETQFEAESEEKIDVEEPEKETEQPTEQNDETDVKKEVKVDEKPPISPKPAYSALTESEVAKAVIAQARENRFEEEDNKPAPRPFKDHRGKF